jgi:SAM-dependent methyltransferase
MSSSDWIDFWDTKHSIYVNERHEAAHFKRIAEDLRSYAPANGAMLDYGCGEALSAGIVAEPVARLILCEPAPNVRAKLAARFAGNGKIAVRKPDDIAPMAAQSFDVIVMHSVSQYLDTAEFDALLKMFHRLLKPGGTLLLGDVIPRRLSAFGDARALLRFGRRNGFWWAALGGLIRTRFSSYWRLRKATGLSRYSESEIIKKFEDAGFTAERARPNIGHNNKRMTFLARIR